jgi:hypothetical protein
MPSPKDPAFDRADAVILATVCLLALGHALWFDHTADDAYISFRYVDNWVRGHGLVFNPGERVMGYSNFLWVVVLYPFALVGVPTDVAARILGVLLAWGTLARVYSYARGELSGRLPALAAVSSLAASGSFALWMLGGLEAQLLGLLLTVGVVGALQVSENTSRSRFVWLGVVFGLASITRPEALIYTGATAIWLWLRNRNRKRAASVILFVSIAGAFVVALSLSAWLYYGDPLPNTYHAKTLPLSAALVDRGLRMARKFVADYRWVPMTIPVFWLVAVRGSVRADGWLPLGLIVVFALFFLGVGGDMLQYHRMWVPVLPMFALLLAEGVSRVRHRAIAAFTIAAVVALILPNSFWGRSIASLRKGDQFLEDAHLVAERLAELPENTLVAANNIGVIGYESRVRILDMLGLTDRYIALASGKELGIPGHEAHDGQYVLDREPDIIITGMPSAVSKPNPTWDTRGGYPSDLDLKRDARFTRRYELVYFALSDGRWSPVYVRRGMDLPRVWRPGEAVPGEPTES